MISLAQRIVQGRIRRPNETHELSQLRRKVERTLITFKQDGRIALPKEWHESLGKCRALDPFEEFGGQEQKKCFSAAESGDIECLNDELAALTTSRLYARVLPPLQGEIGFIIGEIIDAVRTDAGFGLITLAACMATYDLSKRPAWADFEEINGSVYLSHLVFSTESIVKIVHGITPENKKIDLPLAQAFMSVAFDLLMGQLVDAAIKNRGEHMVPSTLANGLAKLVPAVFSPYAQHSIQAALPYLNGQQRERIRSRIANVHSSALLSDAINRMARAACDRALEKQGLGKLNDLVPDKTCNALKNAVFGITSP